MEKNKKIAILIVLIIVAIIVWMPKGARKQVLSKPAPVSIKKVMPRIASVQRKRTEFAGWGRDPFVWSRVGSSAVSDLTLSGIIWDNETSYAIIEGSVVHAGDEVAGKTIKRIEPDRVILSDGLNDYTLQLE
jgi:type II secretory pathway component PulC